MRAERRYREAEDDPRTHHRMLKKLHAAEVMERRQRPVSSHPKQAEVLQRIND